MTVEMWSLSKQGCLPKARREPFFHFDPQLDTHMYHQTDEFSMVITVVGFDLGAHTDSSRYFWCFRASKLKGENL